ncbi:MAG TPA: diguanylate cyclase [Solimonas sp.]|nr:diguanylate cyclase [Solimonas sp.]
MQDKDGLDLGEAEVADRYDIMVLLVDDQPMIGEAVRRMLVQQPGIDFHFCANPLDAIETAKRIKPTVILQDLVMPGVNGLTLVRDYRADPATQDIPIIVLSTKEEPAVKSEAFALGANDYLVKLPDGIELIARIRHHSKAYLNQLQRDEAYRALRRSQQQLLEKNLELERLTNLDGLTGLSNRRYFSEFMEVQWRRAIREQSAFSVLMIDVDDFKRYNDGYGHLAGDEVLRQVGAAIQRCCERPTDLAARFGGEEFVVALAMVRQEEAQAFGGKLLQAVRRLEIPHSGSTVAGTVTVSIGGAATLPQRDDSYLTLIQAADVALYAAKGQGKNRVVVQDTAAASPAV